MKRLELKVCSRCGVKKLLIDFWQDKSKKDGLYSACKKCGYGYIRKGQNHHGERNPMFGRKHSEEAKRKISLAIGSIKGFICPLNLRERASTKYKEWRFKVFKRDNFTCQKCGIKAQGGLGRRVILNADHIKPFSLFPKLRFVVHNGRTLCLDCHKKTNTYGINLKFYATT